MITDLFPKQHPQIVDSVIDAYTFRNHNEFRWSQIKQKDFLILCKRAHRVPLNFAFAVRYLRADLRFCKFDAGLSCSHTSSLVAPLELQASIQRKCNEEKAAAYREDEGYPNYGLPQA